jgi:hypothetical protein
MLPDPLELEMRYWWITIGIDVLENLFSIDLFCGLHISLPDVFPYYQLRGVPRM